MEKGLMAVISDAPMKKLLSWFSYTFYLVAGLLYVLSDLFVGPVFRSENIYFVLSKNCLKKHTVVLRHLIELASSRVKTSQC